MSAQLEIPPVADLQGPRQLQRVKGPSALEGNPRRFLHLTALIATTDYKLTYFGSVLGYLWSFAQPLLFFGVLYVVFGIILAKTLGKVPNFPVLLLMNIVLITFFQQATSAAVPSLVVRENLVRKMHFPRLVIPLAVVCTALIQLTLNFAVVIGFMLVYGLHPRWTWLLMPIALLALTILTVGCAMFLSATYVRYRDVAPIWGVISQALFYATPVFITIEAIQAHGPTLVRFYLCNPLAAIFQEARHWMIGGTPSVPALMGGYGWALVPVGLILAIFAFGFWTFRRQAPRIAEEL